MRGEQAETIRFETDKEEASVNTYFGSALNQYLAMLLLGAMELEHLRVTPTAIRFRGPSINEAQEHLRALLIDPARRRLALDSALPHITQVQVGRFWPMFGPKTRHNVLRRFFSNAEPYMERIGHMRVY